MEFVALREGQERVADAVGLLLVGDVNIQLSVERAVPFRIICTPTPCTVRITHGH